VANFVGGGAGLSADKVEAGLPFFRVLFLSPHFPAQVRIERS
jgi:hypothetical protein